MENTETTRRRRAERTKSAPRSTIVVREEKRTETKSAPKKTKKGFHPIRRINSWFSGHRRTIPYLLLVLATMALAKYLQNETDMLQRYPAINWFVSLFLAATDFLYSILRLILGIIMELLDTLTSLFKHTPDFGKIWKGFESCWTQLLTLIGTLRF